MDQLTYNPDFVRGLIELAAVGIMAYGVHAVFQHRKDQERGFSSLAIQFSAILLVLPIILILSLEKILEGQTSAALIGTLAGYLFSELGKKRASPASASKSEKESDSAY